MSAPTVPLGVPEIRSSVLAAHAHQAHYTATASSSPDLHAHRRSFDRPADPHVRVGDLLTEAPAESIRDGPAREHVEMSSEMRAAVVGPANGMGRADAYVEASKVIKTTKDTFTDMSVKYKETARGRLAVNIIEC